MDPRYAWLRFSQQFDRDRDARMIRVEPHHMVWVPDEQASGPHTWEQWELLHQKLAPVKTFTHAGALYIRAFPPTVWVKVKVHIPPKVNTHMKYNHFFLGRNVCRG